jgi:hypothetical protein
MRRLALLPVLGLLVAPPALSAATSRCDTLATRLADVEAGGDAMRALILARRYARRCVRLNQIQALGSHNSYHIQARPVLFDALVNFLPELVSLEYTHIPLEQQFAMQGIRQIELDVFADPAGSLYADRPILALFGEDPAGPPELLEPGMKVLHVQDIDFETTCTTLVGCLRVVKRWSDGQRGHLPIMILIEAKDDVIPDPLNLGFVTPIPIGPAELDTIDAEIRSVFPKRRLITPDTVRRRAATLEEAILTEGWPTLGKARGKVLFALDNGGRVRDDYLAGRPNLEGRVMFASGDPGQAHAAFVKENDPLSDPARIPNLVAGGYVVRTRADADTVQARTGDVTQRDAALASAAQWVSTDYPMPRPGLDFGTGYQVSIPDGAPARCNALVAPPGCRNAALEQLR